MTPTRGHFQILQSCGFSVKHEMTRQYESAGRKLKFEKGGAPISDQRCFKVVDACSQTRLVQVVGFLCVRRTRWLTNSKDRFAMGALSKTRCADEMCSWEINLLYARGIPRSMKSRVSEIQSCGF